MTSTTYFNMKNFSTSFCESMNEEFNNYSKVKAKGHVLTIRGQSANIPGQLVCTGQFTVPAKKIDFKKVLNLSEFFFPESGSHIFSKKYGSRETNIYERVQAFIMEQYDTVRNADYFIVAINLTKKNGKRDIPNVNAAVLLWLLRYHGRDVIFMDPVDFLKDPFLATKSTPIKMTNFSVVVRWIEQNIKYDVPMDNMGDIKTSEEFVNYQRGQGVPNPREKNAIIRYLKNPNVTFLNIKLAPGKYDYKGKLSGMPKLCYKEFGESVAQIVNQFTDFNEYLQFKDKESVRRMYLVMDEFSGYSMFTIAALKGFGFDKITTVLCYCKGKYTSFNLHN